MTLFTSLMRRSGLFLVLCCLLLGRPRPAWADIAPPRQPPGGNPTNSVPTQVQMIAETVIISVDEASPLNESPLAADLAQAAVEARFTMLNQGVEAESLQVWFPLEDVSGAGDGYGGYPRLEAVQVKVNGQATPTYAGVTPPTSGAANAPDIAWAVFDVNFPPGENVFIEIFYTQSPTGYVPLGQFLYLLETGAGWNGPIASVDLILRLPYPAGVENVVQDSLATTPGGEFQGDAVRWRFADLEPTQDDNWRVQVVLPHYWKWLLAARKDVRANPQDAQAWATLAHAARSAALDGSGKGYFRADIGGLQLLQEANAAYDYSLTLDPTVVAVHNAYVDFLLYWMVSDYTTPLTAQDPRLWRFAQEVNISLAADPGNLAVIDQRDWMATLYPQLVVVRLDGGVNIAGAPEGPEPTSRQEPTVIVPPTATSSPTVATAQATAIPTAARPAVTSTPPGVPAPPAAVTAVAAAPVPELADLPASLMPASWNAWLAQNGFTQEMVWGGVLLVLAAAALAVVVFVVLLLRLAQPKNKTRRG